jgi:type II restriction enzyme
MTLSPKLEIPPQRSLTNGFHPIDGAMKLGFEESQAAYTSGSQSARAWTERWVGDWVYCPNCGHSKISQFPNNSPLADFFCGSCSEEYELKSQKGAFGNKVLDGAYQAKCLRLAANNNPSLFLLNYDVRQLSVTNLFIVPKHFFVRDIIEKRKLWPRRRGAPDGSGLTSC